MVLLSIIIPSDLLFSVSKSICDNEWYDMKRLEENQSCGSRLTSMIVHVPTASFSIRKVRLDVHIHLRSHLHYPAAAAWISRSWLTGICYGPAANYRQISRLRFEMQLRLFRYSIVRFYLGKNHKIKKSRICYLRCLNLWHKIKQLTWYSLIMTASN